MFFELRQHHIRPGLYDLVYQSDCWKNELAPRVPAVAPPHSVIQ